MGKKEDGKKTFFSLLAAGGGIVTSCRLACGARIPFFPTHDFPRINFSFLPERRRKVPVSLPAPENRPINQGRL